VPSWAGIKLLQEACGAEIMVAGRPREGVHAEHHRHRVSDTALDVC
jgi:hypothetical protein